MKILYVSNERGAAAVAARVLHGIAQNVVVSWAQTSGAALHWVEGNRDVRAVIVEAEVQGQPSASFVEQARRHGLTVPIVLVVGQPEQSLAGLNAGADGYVVDSQLQTELPRIVARVIGRERSRREPVRQKLIELEGARAEAEQRLARAEEERHASEQRHASDLAAASARLADVQARQSASLAREARICTALQQRLLELETALRNAEERRASEAVASAEQVAKRHAEFTARLAEAAQWRDTLAAKLNAAAVALTGAQQARRADAAAAAEQLERSRAQLTAARAEAAAVRTSLEGALADAQAAHREVRQRADVDLAAANERQAALEDLLAQEADARTVLDQKLAAAETARQEIDGRHAEELTAAAMRLAEVQAKYEAALGENAAARAAFEQRLIEAASALEGATRERTAEAAAAAEHLAHREAELGAALAEAAAARSALETALADAHASHQQTVQRADNDLAAAMERELELAGQLATESETRAALARDLAASRERSARARQRSLNVASAHRRRTREQRAQLAAQFTAERADAERRLRAKEDEIRQVHHERETLQHLLGTTQEQLQTLHATIDDERQAYERERSTRESELQRMSAEYDRLGQALNHLETAFQTLEQVAGEHAAERARLERVVAERDSQLTAQAERHRAAEQAAEDALIQVQERLRQTLEATSSEIARLRGEKDALERELEAARTDAAALRNQAERVPHLQTQLEASQNERRRQFERAPYGLCRCTADGVITEANHSFVALVGRRRADELRNVDFAAAVSDRAGDLQWLIDRARTTRRTEAVETNWKTQDGRRLIVRLRALSTASGAMEIVVEDITHVRAVEERLRQAQRMEAVGRLASEVAVTCEGLLRDVTRETHEWLAAVGGDSPLRRQGELLLSEATRVASFLRQLGVYGNEQAAALKPVSVLRVLRDLAPVLKRVVGDQIELVLPNTSGSFDVDVGAERVERVLVNLASYARERMPDGGQVKIDLASADIGRKLVARHPNVRPGPQVLITVTELPRTRQVHDDKDRSSFSTDKPGIDLGALVELVGTCGGHLWMEAEAAGNMVVKIHLPKPVAADTSETTEPDAQSGGGRLARWFRTSSASVRS